MCGYVQAERNSNLMHTVRKILNYTLNTGPIWSEWHLELRSSRDSFQLVMKKPLLMLYSRCIHTVSIEKKEQLVPPIFLCILFNSLHPTITIFIKMFITVRQNSGSWSSLLQALALSVFFLLCWICPHFSKGHDLAQNKWWDGDSCTGQVSWSPGAGGDMEVRSGEKMWSPTKHVDKLYQK